ncbi:unnamed protein product [Paramecium pentaurelia]|uniref:Uncharacterized protein n=1 Tax=Paramecium pentaurelia TaxID=43138 RepID=A0A8S1X8Z7_9CILI|nr:unnamed protein product [Paramecium pentaurelia]
MKILSSILMFILKEEEQNNLFFIQKQDRLTQKMNSSQSVLLLSIFQQRTIFKCRIQGIESSISKLLQASLCFN